MNKLFLKFRVELEDRNESDMLSNNGPLFTKWIPNGRDDEITVQVDGNTKLALCFERCGYKSKSSGFIEFDYERKEIEVDDMKRQSVLKGGPLYGFIEMSNLKEVELRAVRDRAHDDENYICLGRRIIKNIIHPYVNRLLVILSTVYGQYWINELDDWDSREQTLGLYCRKLGIAWSEDEIIWNSFEPNAPSQSVSLTVKLNNGTDYISEDDWKDIKLLFNEDFTPSLASEILVKAHKCLDERDFDYAAILAVTSLELAMTERLLEKFSANKTLLKYINSDKFWKMPMSVKMSIFSSLLDNILEIDLEQAIQAINARNALVHDGENLPEEIEKMIGSLLKIIALIIAKPMIRLPESRPSITMFALNE